MFFKKLFSGLKRKLLLLAIASAVFVGATNTLILHRSRGLVHADLESVPPSDVALVLGASPVLSSGRTNQHFQERIDAASRLYHSGKVKHLLVIGDNHRASYDEPTAMKLALIERGIPTGAITCDYAGFRTLDSVVRAKRIFGVEQLTIVTQRYHNARAIAIARHEGIRAHGYCARDVEFRYSIRTELREVLARTATVLDLHVFRRGPKFLGPAEPIMASR